jgi:hypothetical protein
MAMTDASISAASIDTKPCRVCGEPIKKVARICYHCTSYQDWRADLNIGNNVLSLLVALFAVLTVLVPIIENWGTPKTSSLHFAFQGATNNFITFFVSNTGIRPGTIRYPAQLNVLLPIGGAITVPLYMYGITGSAGIVQPGTSAMINLYGKASDLSANDKGFLNKYARQAGCNLFLSESAFGGLDDTAQIELTCPYGFIQNLVGVTSPSPAQSAQQPPSATPPHAPTPR